MPSHYNQLKINRVDYFKTLNENAEKYWLKTYQIITKFGACHRDSSWCQAVRPAKGASHIVGGNPTWKGINHSTSSEPWSRSGNVRFKRRQLGGRDGY